MLLVIGGAVLLVILLPLAVATVAITCLIAIPVSYLVTLARVLAARPAWLPDAWRGPRTPAGPDPAIPQYFYGPAGADAVQAARLAYGECRRAWRRGFSTALWPAGQRRSSVTRLLAVAVVIGTAAGVPLGTLVAAYWALIHFLVVCLSAVVVRVLSGALRGALSVIAAFTGTTVACPGCSQEVRYPAYGCPGPWCGRRHRDVRPGRYGIVRRRCECGTPMRILPSSGPPATKAFCPNCGHELDDHQVADTIIDVPVLGTSRTGKAQLLRAIATRLKAWDRDGRLAVVLADPGSTGDSDPIAPLVRAYAIRLITDGGAHVLRVFDAAADSTCDAAGQARTFILLIDPPPAGRQAGLAPAPLPAPAPIGIYELARRQIMHMGVDPGEARLAVAFSGGDLTGDAPSRRIAIQALRRPGLDELVRSVLFDFKDGYFVSAAAMEDGGSANGPAESFVRWLLAGHGIAPAPSRAAADPSQERDRSWRWNRRCVLASVVLMSVMPLAWLLVSLSPAGKLPR